MRDDLELSPQLGVTAQHVIKLFNSDLVNGLQNSVGRIAVSYRYEPSLFTVFLLRQCDRKAL